MRINLIDVGLKGKIMNALKQLQKYERLAEIAHNLGCYKCARKWSIKAEKIESVINALENVEKEIKQVELVTLNGSEKQIAWASAIREDKIAQIQKLADGKLVEDAIQFLKTQSDSKWWIENRIHSPEMLAYASKLASKVEIDPHALTAIADSTKKALIQFEKNKAAYGEEYAKKVLKRFYDSGHKALNKTRQPKVLFEIKNDLAIIDNLLSNG